MPDIIVIAHNIRSTHNIGSIFRTADGFGVEKIIVSGYSPYPTQKNDVRLPHIHQRLTRDIHKTALGAEQTVPFEYHENLADILPHIKLDGYRVVGLEQDPKSLLLPDYAPPQRVALLLGEEVGGIDSSLLSLCDELIEIPMIGNKESFNVSVAAGIALYHLAYA